MNNNLDYGYFDDAIKILGNTLGVAEPVSFEHYSNLVRSGAYLECVNKVAMQYGLNYRVSIKIVPKGYNIENKHYSSTGLVTTDIEGRGTEGISAQVRIPNNLPLFGSSKQKNIKVQVTVEEECSVHPQTFVAIIAHELAHLLLETLRHPEKNNEIYADLMPLLLGFINIVEVGRKTIHEVNSSFDRSKTIHTRTYGYLSDNQFKYVKDKINITLHRCCTKKNELIKNVNIIENKVILIKSSIENFSITLNQLGIHKRKIMSYEDGKKIMRLYDARYLNAYHRVFNKAESIIMESKRYAENLKHYDKNKLKRISELKGKQENLLYLLSVAENTICKDTVFLKNHFNTKQKIRSKIGM